MFRFELSGGYVVCCWGAFRPKPGILTEVLSRRNGFDLARLGALVCFCLVACVSL